MTFDFFEGPAGTGKTHSLIALAEEVVGGGVLGDEAKLLALTFMNGSRQRLDSHLRQQAAFRRRFDCQTLDVFARRLVSRRRSLITSAMRAQIAALNEFDGPCSLAASLLEDGSVRQWIARTFPLVLVDEAQDLDEHRVRILQGLSKSCQIIAAADAFQCLRDGRETGSLIEWLETAGRTHRLTQPQRTQRQGLLAAALAVRNGKDVTAVLKPNIWKGGTTWNGAGFRLTDVPVKTGALLSWSIANDIAQRAGRVVVLTPDAGSGIIRAALNTVQTKHYERQNGSRFGPFQVAWERHHTEEADALLDSLKIPSAASWADLRLLLSPLAERAAIAGAIGRMDRLRRTQGQSSFSAAEVREFVRDAVRDRARFGVSLPRGHLAMTIQQAKNREFPNVIVLWPHTATGSAEHLRRLLYNGITRAQNHCTVIVLGRGRLNGPPFSS